ncbi:hypothetical protein Mapa_001968 [Marchantia paleacea]|nr:hypothetical protein Mapa_001968 [Marchantia paleacea]
MIREYAGSYCGLRRPEDDFDCRVSARLSLLDMLGAPPLFQAVNPSPSSSSLMILQSQARLLKSWASHCHSILLRSQSRHASELVKSSQWWSICSPTPSCNLPNHLSVSSGIQRSDFSETRRSVDMATPAVAPPVAFNLDPVPRDVPLFQPGVNGLGQDVRPSRLVVIGHRGCGKNNALSIGDTPGCRLSIRENTIKSFNLAASNGADYVEFDVQVTKDNHPVLFHDDLILSEDQASRIRDLTLEEFLSFGPQKEQGKIGKNLVRKSADGVVKAWSATLEDSLCTLKDAFENVQPSLGFNIEMKFHDTEETSESEYRRSIIAVLADMEKYANGRKIYFSSFHPEAAIILRQEQSTYPVFFLTCGGEHTYADARRNSVEAAINLCKENGLQGVVTEVLPILKKPDLAKKVKEAGLSLLTYGDYNNVAEALAQQYTCGVDGIIVDCVREIVTASRTVHALLNFVQPDWSKWVQQPLEQNF